MGRRIFARVMAGLLTSSALWTVNAFAQVERPWVWIQAKPSIPKDMLCQPGDYEVFAFRVGCYDVGKGRWKDCETLFMEYYSLSGVPAEERPLWMGGHEHSRSTGDVFRTLGFLASAVDESGGSDPTLFYGHTLTRGGTPTRACPKRAASSESWVDTLVRIRDSGFLPMRFGISIRRIHREGRSTPRSPSWWASMGLKSSPTARTI